MPRLNVRVPRNTKVYRSVTIWDRIGLLIGSAISAFCGLSFLNENNVELGLLFIGVAVYGLWMMTRKRQRLN
ncbi:hypothetical protein FIV00_00065 [Labrenzia sp. THAF82]|nr:hypothetical protein FIV00_00065 [Labrenzia sp. THAF82]